MPRAVPCMEMMRQIFTLAWDISSKPVILYGRGPVSSGFFLAHLMLNSNLQS